MNSLRRFNDWLNKIWAGGKAGPLPRFALLFIIVFVLLQGIYLTLTDTVAYRFYIETLTVQPSAALIHWMAAQDGVLASGNRLLWPGGGLSIINGCDGAEAMKLLVAAFVAVAGAWRSRLQGVALGLSLIYILNQARIVALYFAVRHDRTWFDLIHGLVGPLIIIAVATLFFAWWIGRDDPSRAA